MKSIKNGVYTELATERTLGHIPYTRTITNLSTTLRDYETGETIFLAITGSGNVTITLPAPYPGLNFKFISTAAPAGAGDGVITCVENDKIYVQTNRVSKLQYHIQTLSLAAPLVSGNKVNGVVMGNPRAEIVFSGSSDATLQAIATSIALDPSVDSAVVTVVGGNQTGNDDRTITVTGSIPGAFVDLSSYVVTVGSVTTFNIATTKSPIDVIEDYTAGAPYDSVTLEGASEIGEWFDFISDGTLWFCRTTAKFGVGVSFTG
jgi:hypothetical protein